MSLPPASLPKLNNPYQTTLSDSESLEITQNRAATICRRCAIAAIFASVLTTGWMILGGLVAYAPTVTVGQIQGIYLSRMLSFGTASVGLQLLAVGLFIRATRPPSRKP